MNKARIVSKNTNKTESGSNLFNGIVVAGFVDYTSGNILQPNGDNNYVATDFIAIEPETIYQQIYSPAGGQVAFYDKNRHYISGLLLDAADNISYESPTNAAYLRTTAYTPFLSLFAVRKFIENNNSLRANKLYIVVAKDATGDFNTLTQAVNAAQNGSIIFVKAGIYDNEIVRAWGKNISIVGENPLNTIIKNGYNSYDRPPIEISCGLLMNLTVYAYDGGAPSTGPWGWNAYAVHIDHDGLYNNSLNIENCILKSDKNFGVGVGLRQGLLRFANCRFYSRDLAPVFVHDSVAPATGGNQNIAFENCVGESEKSNTVIVFHSQKTAGAKVVPEFINCSFTSRISDKVRVEAINQDNTHGTATKHGTFMNLINFYQSKTSRNNYPAVLNYCG